MSSKLCRFNKGFSLVDLLIVIAIVGILAAVLLPSLRINRDGGSRRTACLNNIRNISLACVSYEMTNQQFPAAVSSHSESFLVRILPMLDQNPLYDDFRSEPDKNLAIEILAGVEIEIFAVLLQLTTTLPAPIQGSPLTTQALPVLHRVIP